MFNPRNRRAVLPPGVTALLALARNEFGKQAYFAVSSLGAPPRDDGGFKSPEPVGVENPLFWALRELA